MTDTFLALRAHIHVTLYSYFKKGCRQKNITRQSRKALWDIIDTLFLILGLWNVHLLLSFSNRKHTSVAPCAILWKNSENKATHNTFRDCRVHFFQKKPAWILFGFCLVWRSNLRRSLKPFDIPHCLQAQVPSKMQRVDEGSSYTRKRRSLSDTRTGKYECYACNLRSWWNLSCATTSFHGCFC